MIPSPPFYLPQSFTDGNWGLHIPGITRSISTTEHRLLVVHPDGERIIGRFDEGYCNRAGSIPAAERQANALLARAGPAMFHALHRLLLCPDLNEDSLSPETREAIDNGLDALRKATTLPPQ